MKSFFLIIMLLPVSLWAQTRSGIHFTELPNWQQVIKKAKEENKSIFIDCYATWCGPCKLMDSQIYPDSAVGVLMNDKFINVRLQVDRTDKDNAYVRSWYEDAESLADKYSITAFPTLLFLNPDGELINTGIGFRSPDQFLKLANFVNSDEGVQYNRYLQVYNSGNFKYTELPSLIKTAKEIVGNKEQADSMASDYIWNYLEKLPIGQLLTKDNMIFYAGNDRLWSSKSRVFKLCYQYPAKIDSLIPGMSQIVVNLMISREDIDPKLYSDNNSVNVTGQWANIEASIAKKYNSHLADRLVLDAQIRYYKKAKNWEKYAAFRTEIVKRYPPKSGTGLFGDIWRLNSDAWGVFMECNNPRVLKVALGWSKKAVEMAEKDKTDVLFAYYDTESALLYKLGRVRKAIRTEQLAIENCHSTGKTDWAHDFGVIIEKMHKGKPFDAIWTIWK